MNVTEQAHKSEQEIPFVMILKNMPIKRKYLVRFEVLRCVTPSNLVDTHGYLAEAQCFQQKDKFLEQLKKEDAGSGS